jgi:hypothetical protein
MAAGVELIYASLMCFDPESQYQTSTIQECHLSWMMDAYGVCSVFSESYSSKCSCTIII